MPRSQRSLISLNSRYDRYVHGYADALSPRESEGLNVFRSFVARCSECHTPPLFTNEQIAVIGAPGSTVAGIPAGTGILVMAADDVVIEGNVISDNKVAGIIITDHANAANITVDPGSEPNSDRVSILDNVMLKNGYDTIKEVKALMLTEGKRGGALDIVRVGPSPGSCIINRHQYVTAGVGDFAECAFTNTAATSNCLLQVTN
jgi:parallel beta-helix repeat protein